MSLFDLELLRKHLHEEAAVRLATRFEYFGMPPGPPVPLLFTTPTGIPALWWDRNVKLTIQGARPLPPAGK